MNSSVHFGKNEGSPSCVGTRGPRKTQYPAKSAGQAGQAGGIRTAKMALFVALGYLRIVGESRLSRWWVTLSWVQCNL